MSNIPVSRPGTVYYVLGVCAILHSALLLLRATESLPAGLPEWSVTDRFWIALALLWFLWPIVMALHPGRSWLRFAVPILLSLLFLMPSGRFYYWIIEEELHSGPSPTRDKPLVEKTKDLGSGFRQVVLAEFIEGGFESVYHGEYLFYRDRKLADFLSASVAPSKQFAIYIDPSNRLFLFRVADQTVTQLLPDPVTQFGGFEWNEAAGYVAVYSSGQPRTFPLK